MSSANVTIIECGERLDVSVVSERREEWQKQLEGGGGLCLDVSQLTRIDAAGVQLLLAAEQECRMRNDAFRLQGSSPALSRALDRLGLGGWEAGR